MAARRFRNFIAALFLGTASTIALLPGTATAAKYNYDDGTIDVERGDIPMDFQKHFEQMGVHVPFRDILRENKIYNTRKMGTGIQLAIPQKYLPAIQAAAKGETAAEVVSGASPKYDFARGKIRFEDGDTLWDIEQHLKNEYGVYVPFAAIQRASNIRNVRRIANGTELTIPAKYLPSLQAASKSKNDEIAPVVEAPAVAEEVPAEITTVETGTVTDKQVLITLPGRSPIDLKITDPELAKKISEQIIRESEVYEDWDRENAAVLAAQLDKAQAEEAKNAAASTVISIRAELEEDLVEYVTLRMASSDRELTEQERRRLAESYKAAVRVFKAEIANSAAADAFKLASARLAGAEDMFELAERQKREFLQETQDLILQDPNTLSDINARLREKDPLTVATAPAIKEDKKPTTLAPVVVPMVDIYTETTSIVPKKVKTAKITVPDTAYAEEPEQELTGAAAAAAEMAGKKTPADLLVKPRANQGIIGMTQELGVCQRDFIRINPPLEADYLAGRRMLLDINAVYKAGGLAKVESEAQCAEKPHYRNVRQRTASVSGGADMGGFNDVAQAAVPCSTVYSKADPNDPNKTVLTRGCFAAPSRYIG